MTNEEKIALFKKEIDYMEIEDIKDFFKKAITLIPDYFFEVPASSSGQFHSALECGFGGLVYHTRSVAKVANYLVNLQQYKSKLNEVEKDCVVCAALLHDCLKHDWENKTGFSVHQHPVIAAIFIRSDERLDGILSDEFRIIIGDAVASHSGEFTTSKRSKIVLPEPKTLVQELVHLSDYIASRGDIHILFDGEDNKPKLPDPNEYTLNFGKHSGKSLIYVFNHHRDYLDWCKENIKREPLMSLIKLLEEQEKSQEDDEI
jgi:hypothetical protein